MEPAETEDSFSELLFFVDGGESAAQVSVQTSHVWLDTSRRLKSHLHRSLQQRDREVLRGGSGHQKTESVLILSIDDDLIKFSLELWQETN